MPENMPEVPTAEFETHMVHMACNRCSMTAQGVFTADFMDAWSHHMQSHPKFEFEFDCWRWVIVPLWGM